MHLQPSHFWFGQQEDAFYRGQFVIWPRVLMIMRVGGALQVGVYTSKFYECVIYEYFLQISATNQLEIKFFRQ